jgi:hypothetical protein
MTLVGTSFCAQTLIEQKREIKQVIMSFIIFVCANQLIKFIFLEEQILHNPWAHLLLF